MAERFDIHVNLGAFPGSVYGKKQRYIGPKEMNDYFVSHGITHALVLYNRDEYDLLAELSRISETKCYGVQCAMGHKESPTDEKNLPEWDVNIEGRSFLSGGHCYGIKMASNRGWWLRDGELVNGIQYMSKTAHKIMSSLPDGSVVSLHTQGTISVKPQKDGNPRTLGFLSSKCFRNLKFINNHTGDYGTRLNVSKPDVNDYFKTNGDYYAAFIRHTGLVAMSLSMAEEGYNLFNDMSCYTPQKGFQIRENLYSMWTVGSDFPFQEKYIDYTKERKLFNLWTDYIPDKEAVRFFESTMEELIEWSHERYNKYNEWTKQYRKHFKDTGEKLQWSN
jgi:hypothetical protein